MVREHLLLFLNANLLEGTRSAWRLGQLTPDEIFDLRHYSTIAKELETARFDAIFFGDSPALNGSLEKDLANTPLGRLDPMILQAALLRDTSELGHIVTASTLYNQPFNLARRISSLDHISGGRVGWNIVTSFSPRAALNFGLSTLPDPEERYTQADEFVGLADALWHSWGADVLARAQPAGLWGDASGFVPVSHRGDFFRLEGVLNLPRSPQVRPILVQAGSSGPGLALAAKWADLVFTSQVEIETAREFRVRLQLDAAARGRRVGRPKVVAGLVPITGSTEEEAERLLDNIIAAHGFETLRQEVAQYLGVDLSNVEPDQRLTFEELAAFPVKPPVASGLRHAILSDAARHGNFTLEQLFRTHRAGHKLVAGTPEKIADHIETWFRTGAVDGFMILPDPTPRAFSDFASEVVPLLQTRGIFKRDYVSGTLREKFGLDIG